jgi:hypothetical protein
LWELLFDEIDKSGFVELVDHVDMPFFHEDFKEMDHIIHIVVVEEELLVILEAAF